MDGDAHEGDFLSELDKAPVPASWRPDLSQALLRLDRSVQASDRLTLAPLLAYIGKHSRTLREHAQKTARVEPPSDIHGSHSGCATLFRYSSSNSPGLELLVCIGLNALLEATTPERPRAARLLSMVRGALDSPTSKVASSLSSTATIQDLMRRVAVESAASALPKNFVEIWDAWLSNALTRWMLIRPDRLRRAFEPIALVTSLKAPEVLVTSQGQDPEDATPLTCFESDEKDADLPASIRAGRAKSAHLERLSEGDLCSPPEFRFPRELDERLCQLTLERSTASLSMDTAQAEPYVALMISLAGGVREIDLQRVVWGGEGQASPYAVDPDLPVLYMRIKRPANAVQPPEDLGAWLEPTAEVLPWPLSPRVHTAIVGLAKPGAPRIGDAVLPWLAASLSAPYRLRDVISRLMPEAQVGALMPRLALAAELAKELGSEMAQLAMGDTFHMSLVPAYYSAMTESDLVEVIARVQSRRFAQAIEPTTKRMSYVGSRLVLTDAAAQRWSTRLRDAARHDARTSADPITAWRAHRDYLAAALVCATGHRPEGALGRIRLSDVIPEYGLIVLQDKQVDALRATRIAATGRLWLSELRRYLDRLLEIVRESADSPAGKLADAIVRGEEPLFSIPEADGSTATMTAATLRASMPPEFEGVANFYRHRLNQGLQRHGVDPELRHAQLGWIAGTAHAHADLSPRAPIDLGESLGPTIDELLVADDWWPKSARKTRWTWEGIPMPSAVDWDARFLAHQRKHQEDFKAVWLKLLERRGEVEPRVLTRMASAFEQFFLTLRLNVEKRRLEITPPAGKQRVLVGHDHHALICDRVRLDDADPSSALEAVTARIWIFRLVRRALKVGLIEGPSPARIFLTGKSDPSPFVLGLGTAVRHAMALRQALEGRAKLNRPHDMRYLTVLSILANSAHRRIAWALAATNAASTAVRSKHVDHFIRITASVEGEETPMVYSGVAATLLIRRKKEAPTARAPKVSELDAWVQEHLGDSVAWADSPSLTQFENVFLAAAQVELSGVERLLLNRRQRTAAESSLRCVARDDEWPATTADSLVPEASAEGNRREPVLSEQMPPKLRQELPRKAYLTFAGLLNKQTFGRIRALKSKRSIKRASDGKRGWRRALSAELRTLADASAANPNLLRLIEYSLDHLRYGSEAGNTLSHRSLQREIAQIGWPLLVNLGERDLTRMTGEALELVYRQVLLSKSTGARPYAFEEIQRFQRYLQRTHALPAVEMSGLGSLAGSRMVVVDPGLITPDELVVTFQALLADAQSERARSDSSPDFLRLAELRCAMFLILEASGIRPGSAYGLTLVDLHFLDDGDFVHVTTATCFGEAKTRASVGFILLEGELWTRHRHWISAFIEQHRAGISRDTWAGLPLFSVRLGQPARFNQEHLTRRIDELLKWATGNSKAHCYWLRKTRISERFRIIQKIHKPSARNVYAVMTLSGHAMINTPVESYINDAAHLHFSDIRCGESTHRSAALAYSQLSAGPLDMAWSRSGEGPNVRMSVLLDALGAESEAAPATLLTAPPLLRRFKPFSPSHIGEYARARHSSGSRAEAILQAGITDAQADHLDELAYQMLMRRGCTPWPIAFRVGARSVMHAPRRFAGTEKAFDLLVRAPSADALTLATLWLEQPYVGEMHGSEFNLELITQADVADARSFLANTSLNFAVIMLDDRHLLREISNPSKSRSHGHGSAIAWVLAITWLFAQMVGNAKPE